jgi:hypothetical protein
VTAYSGSSPPQANRGLLVHGLKTEVSNAKPQKGCLYRHDNGGRESLRLNNSGADLTQRVHQEAATIVAERSLHCGPCTTLTLNDGSIISVVPVNRAARLQRESRGGDIVLSQAAERFRSAGVARETRFGCVERLGQRLLGTGRAATGSNA